jgi:hypothetical protein
MSGRFNVDVTSFDDAGREATRKMWSSKHGHTREETLEEFLAWLLEVPEDEASSLAAQIRGPWFDEWRSAGGEDRAKSLTRGAGLLFVVLVSVALLALVGVATLLWLVVRAL